VATRPCAHGVEPGSLAAPPRTVGSIRMPTLAPLVAKPRYRRAAMTPDMSAKVKRDMAARARRLAGTLVLDADRQRLLEYADELDREAEALERQAHQGPAAPVVNQAAPTSSGNNSRAGIRPKRSAPAAHAGQMTRLKTRRD
jgi:hypothetical protein